MTKEDIQNLSVKAVKVTGVMTTPQKMGYVDAVISVKKSVNGKDRDVFAVRVGDMTIKLSCKKVKDLLQS